MPEVHQANLLTPRDSAILLLLLVRTKNEDNGKDLTRVRLAEITLKRLWGRHRLPAEFLREVEDWLFRAGWAFFYAGTTYAAVKTSAVEGWPRVSSKHLSDELEEVSKGKFDFDRHLGLLSDETSGDED
jgi:hypothetical protein